MNENLLMSSMLCTDYDGSPLWYPGYAQPKLDGVNARFAGGVFWSRDDKQWPEYMTEHIAEELRSVGLDYVQGEFYVHGWPLARINGAMAVRRSEVSDDTFCVRFNVFDSVSSGSFEERFVNLILPLREAVSKLRYVGLVTTHAVTDKKQLFEFYRAARKAGLEGVIYRQGQCLYEPGERSKDLIRLKPERRLTATIVGFKQGTGKYRNVVGSIACSYNGCVFYVNAGTDQLRWHVTTHQHEVLGTKINITFERFSEFGVPLKPRLKNRSKLC